MYGPHGQNGFFAGYANGASDDYGGFFVPIMIGLGVGAVGTGGAYWWSKGKAEEEMERHTGGTVKLPSGETVTADEAHDRLCAAGVITNCGPGTEPSNNNTYVDADGKVHTVVPEGFWNAFADTMNPTTVFKHPEYLKPGALADAFDLGDDPRGKIPKWAFWAGAAAMGAGVFYWHKEQKKKKSALGL